MEVEIKASALMEFSEALYGARGEMDAWLECHDEKEVRAYILAFAEAYKAGQQTGVQK